MLLARPRVRPTDAAVLLLLTAAMLLTHQLSTFVVLVLVAAASLAYLLKRPAASAKATQKSALVYTVLFASMLTIGWALTGNGPSGVSFLEAMARYLVAALQHSKIGVIDQITTAGQYAPSTNLLFDLGYCLYLALALPVAIAWLGQRANPRLALAVGLGCLYLFTYGVPALTGSGFLVPDRWFPTIGICLSVLAATYLATLAARGITLKHRLFPSLLVGTVVFFMITSPTANHDSPLYAVERALQVQFRCSEMAGISTIADHYAGTMTIDGTATETLLRELELPNKVAVFSAAAGKVSLNDLPLPGAVVLRHAIFQQPVRVLVKSVGMQDIPRLDSSLFADLEADQAASRVYANPSVTTFTLE